MTDHSASRRLDVLQEQAPHLIAPSAPPAEAAPATEALNSAIVCLELARAELRRGTANANWYAARHLEDALKEGRRAGRLVKQLPQSV